MLQWYIGAKHLLQLFKIFYLKICSLIEIRTEKAIKVIFLT